MNDGVGGQPTTRAWRRRGAIGFLSALLVAACAVPGPRDPSGAEPGTELDRLISARGGPLPRVRKVVRARVFAGLEGEWEWALGYVVPDRFQWTIRTFGQDQIWLRTGAAEELRLGTAARPLPPDAARALASQHRFTAITQLDALRSPDLAVWEVVEGGSHALDLRVRWRPSGETYLLGFGPRGLLRVAEGPVELPEVGAGHLRVSFADYRRAAGLLLPHRATYRLGGRVILEERVAEWSTTVDPLIRTPRP